MHNSDFTISSPTRTTMKHIKKNTMNDSIDTKRFSSMNEDQAATNRALVPQNQPIEPKK